MLSDMIFAMPPKGIQTHWASPENWDGAKGAAGKALARWVQVECTHPGVLFEDSAFDMPAGSSRTIRPILTRGLRPADVAEAQVIVRARNAPVVRIDLCRLQDGGRFA